MEAFIFNFQGKDYKVECGLHDGFYSVSSGEASGLLSKDAEGEWVLMLQTSEPLAVDATELDDAIEKTLNQSLK